MSSSSFPLNAIFLRGAARTADFPPETLPEIAFVGRSNVGKSSLINALLNRKKLAHISKKPGKTAQINFFDVANRFLLVDMPGYGYAAVSQKMRASWGALIPAYFETRNVLIHTCVLIDSRHPPQKTDLQLIQFLIGTPHPFTFILTKADKTPATLLETHEHMLTELAKGSSLSRIFPFSIKNPAFITNLRNHLLQILP